MFKVVAVDWGDNEHEQEFGSDVVKAAEYAERVSVNGNTDYAIIFHDGIPKIKYQDGEMVKI